MFVLDRSSNVGYACFENDSDIVRGVSRVFPLFFFAVAALVCITTMTRMVDEQRTQAGVLKALGYSNGAILSQYFLYAGIASVLGCVLGIAAGSYFLPKMIWHAYNIMYGFTGILYAFDWPLALVSSGAYLLCALGTTWYVVHAELQKPAAELIRPRAPKAGKRILLERLPLIWDRLPFLHKVSIRNILRFKKRMVMMMIGIGGCTALLITGFGIQDSISSVVDYQYDEITRYDAAVTFQHALSGSEREDFLAVCEKSGAEGLSVCRGKKSGRFCRRHGQDHKRRLPGIGQRGRLYRPAHAGENADPLPAGRRLHHQPGPCAGAAPVGGRYHHPADGRYAPDGADRRGCV